MVAFFYGNQATEIQGFQEKSGFDGIGLFSTAAFQVAQTMTGNEVKRKGPRNKELPSIPFCKMFFNKIGLFQIPGKLEEFVRGSLGTRGEKVDLKVRDALRNFLFERVEGEDGFDLVALNIQRGRDHALPSYNAVCRRFGLPPARKFADISSDRTVQSKLATAYGSVDKVEAISGMLAQDLKSGSSLPPCMLRIWVEEFTRIRDGDGFYYENGKQFDNDLMRKIPRVQQLFNNSVDTMKEIIARNTKVDSSEFPKRIFLI